MSVEPVRDPLQGGLSSGVKYTPGRVATPKVEPENGARSAGVETRRQPLRLDLQQRAPQNLRRHLVRTARRFFVLVIADLGAFAIMREFLRSVRDLGAFGQTFMSFADRVTPRGVLSGWEYAFALLVGLFATGTYGRGDMRRDPKRVLAACAVATALPFWMVMWTRGPETVLVQYLVTTAMVWLGLVIERQTLDRAIAWIAPREENAPRTLFVGSAADCHEVMALPAFKSNADFRVVGFVESSIAPSPGALGALPDLARCLHDVGAETVVVCGYLSDVRFQDVVDTALASGCQLLSVPRSTLLAGVQPTLQFRSGQPLIELTAPSLKAWQLAVKRIVDVIGATGILVLISPVLAAIAAAIKLDSTGPVLFTQERVGQGGMLFQMHKFRTMRAGAPQEFHRERAARFIRTGAASDVDPEGGTYKITGDPRITRVGAWLRRWSLDELPQLFNVIVGTMSLVGPRPQLVYEFELYDHWQYDRLGIKPGITGLWQVSGRNRLNHQQMCELDVRYVREWSIFVDAQIMLKTIPVVLLNSGRTL